MSEDNTHRARQLFYALRLAELTQQAKDMAAVLDPELFGQQLVHELKIRMDHAAELGGNLLQRTRKLMD